MANMDYHSVFLIRDEKFPMTFERERALGENDTGGNAGISSKGSFAFEVMSTNQLTEQVEGEDEFDVDLRTSLIKALGNREEEFNDSTAVSWVIAFVSGSRATVKISVDGVFFESFLSECTCPVKLILGMKIPLGNELISINSEVMSPSLLIRELNGSRRTSVFKAELKKEVREIRMETDKNVNGSISMELVIIQDWVLAAHPCKLGTMGQNVLENKIDTDFQIIADDDTPFDCHKVFLAGNSKPFAAMLQMECKESKEKAIKLKMSAKGVKALLKFIYYEDTDDPMESCSIAMELLEIGHLYDVLELEKTMRNIFLHQQYSWFDMDTALSLYHWTLNADGNEDLKWTSLAGVQMNMDGLKESKVFDKMLEEDVNSAKELIALSFKI